VTLSSPMIWMKLLFAYWWAKRQPYKVTTAWIFLVAAGCFSVAAIINIVRLTIG
jgi:hypothetical protein